MDVLLKMSFSLITLLPFPATQVFVLSLDSVKPSVPSSVLVAIVPSRPGGVPQAKEMRTLANEPWSRLARCPAI